MNALLEISKRLERPLVFSDSALNPVGLCADIQGPFDDLKWKLCRFSSIHGDKEPLVEATDDAMCFYLNMKRVITSYTGEVHHVPDHVIIRILRDLGFVNLVMSGVHGVTGCTIGNIRRVPPPQDACDATEARAGHGRARGDLNGSANSTVKRAKSHPTIGLVVHMQGLKENGEAAGATDVQAFISEVNFAIRKWLCRAYVISPL